MTGSHFTKHYNQKEKLKKCLIKKCNEISNILKITTKNNTYVRIRKKTLLQYIKFFFSTFNFINK